MIITDGVHLVSDESEEELHRFALQKMGFKRHWYQNHVEHPHYDLTTPNARRRSLAQGAELVDGGELLKRAWWTKKGDGNGEQTSSRSDSKRP